MTDSTIRPDARAVALSLLEAVLDHKQAFDHALERNEALSQLEPRDRAFARLLAAMVLRRLGTLDKAIDSALERPEIIPAARHVLRLGLAQLHYLQTPPHAAISTAVDLAEERAPRLKGLVNAILRKHETLPFDESGAANLPGWLWQRWVETYGPARAEEIAAAILREAPLDITAKVPGDWVDRLDATRVPTNTLRRESGGQVETLPGFAEGAWWVQDLAASLPVKLMRDLAGKTVFDLCAAPGGKTAQLAAAGAIVTAIDRAPPRLARVTQNLERLGLAATLVAADASAWSPPDGRSADAVLLDAPCLATGTIRRHPDIPWLKSPADLAALAALQVRLLDHVASLLKPGGMLVYCTCSLEPEEGEAQIAAFLARSPDFTRDPIVAAELPDLEMLVNEAGEVRALPIHLADRGGMDGFFIARLRREALLQ